MTKRHRIYARELNELGLENAQRLLDDGATLTSAAIHAEGTHTISVENVDRFTAIALASSLITHLDTGKPPLNRREILEDFEASNHLTRKEEPVVFSKRSRDLGYQVIVGQIDTSKFVLQANIKEHYAKEDFRWANERINLGLISILNGVSLQTGPSMTAGSEILEAESPEVEDDDDESPSEYELMDPSTEKEANNFQNAYTTLRMLGFSKEESGSKEADQFWEACEGKPLSVVDLFMESVREKMTFYGKDKYLEEESTIQDLMDISNKFPPEGPADLRNEQEKRSIEIFSNLGMNGAEIGTLFQWKDPVISVQLRYVAWLSTQPFMEPFTHEVKALMKTKKPDEEFSPKALFGMAIQQASEAYKEHRDNRNENYDFSLGFQARAYNNKRNNLAAVNMMGLNILYRRDISKLIN